MWFTRGSGYSALEETENKDDVELLKDRELEELRRANRMIVIVAGLLALIALLELGWILRTTLPGWSNTNPADQTEFESARIAIGSSYEQRQFAGEWIYDDENNFVKRSVDLAQPQYFGNPHDLPEMEANWNSLLEVQFLALTEREATAFPNLTNVAGSDDKYIELAVTHSLQCVNHLRKMLYKSYYNQTDLDKDLQDISDPEGFYLMHMDYCLEQLFESALCHSDLTPAPVYSFVPNTRRATFAVGGTHTCRNFESIRSWLYDRAKQRPSLNTNGTIYHASEDG